MKKGIAATAALATLAVIGFGAAADAAPRKGDTLEIDCDTLGTLEVVVFSNGPASPGLVVGSHQVGIPYALDITGTFTPTVGDVQTFHDEFEHPAPRNGRLDHCTFHQVESDESGTLVLEGDVSISYTPTR
jgi:hypothetical protein